MKDNNILTGTVVTGKNTDDHDQDIHEELRELAAENEAALRELEEWGAFTDEGVFPFGF